MEHKDLGDTEAARNKLDTVIFFINFHWRDTDLLLCAMRLYRCYPVHLILMMANG